MSSKTTGRRFPSAITRTGTCLAICLLFPFAAATPAVRGGEPGVRGAHEPWAILVGVERYHRAPPLRHTLNDVHALAQTLCERGGYDAEHVAAFVDDAPDPKLRTLRETLVEQLPRWLAQPQDGDSVIVYFSGHGFRDRDGRLFLAPIDCDPDDPAATGIPVEWFRSQLAGCRAKFKLLVLDACHAGSEKGADRGVTAKDLGEPFRDLEGVVTLASSTADQKSLIWEDKQQSLFSYWLNQGLKGHADWDGDGGVDIDELNKYVYQNVTQSARLLFPREQTPVRIVRSGTPGVPLVVQLQPLSLKQVLSDIADQLAWAMQKEKLGKVGVLEFTNDTRIGELLGADFGLLGRYCAEEIEQRLTRASAGQFRVMDRRRLEKALEEEAFSVDALGSADALRRLSSSAGGMPAVVLGTLRSRHGRVVTLRCKLQETDRDELAASAGGTAWLNESEWAMLGKSVAVSKEDYPPPLPGRDATDELVRRMDEKAEQPHPLADPKFPFRVAMYVDGRMREGVFRGNDYLVPVRNGETYEIRVTNHSNQFVAMRLLVDGLNTLPQPADGEKGISTHEIAKRVSLENARPWLLDPSRAKTFAVRGFVTETGASGRLREFRVTDAASSLAARKNYTEQIGIITAAFYSTEVARSGGPGTAAGNERAEAVNLRRDVRPGQLLAVVHLKYVYPER